MGFMSSIHRFHEAGEQPNVNNVAEYGEPVHSLYTTSKVFSLHSKIDVTDDQERPVYHVSSKPISLHDKTDITDDQGNFVAHIERKIFSLHQRHYVSMHDGLQFELSTELFHLIKDITNIEGLGWQLQGNILGLNFTLLDEQGQPIAVIGQKLISLHDKYCIDIYQPQYEQIAVAILITLQHMMRDRRAASSSSYSSSSSN